MKSTNPWTARVVAEIGLEDAVAAIEHFVEYLPADRFSIYISDRLFKAAREMEDKALSLPTCNTSRLLTSQKLATTTPAWGNSAPFTTGLVLYGDLAKPCVALPGFGSSEYTADHSDSTLCPECFVWSNNKGPSRHKMDCSSFGSELRKNEDSVVRGSMSTTQEVEGEVWPR